MTNMETVANVLGITLGEYFYITDYEGSYMLTNGGLIKFTGSLQTQVVDNTLDLLLQGKLTIDQRYLPSKDTTYYLPTIAGVEQVIWHNNTADRYYFDNYLVCETISEAEILYNKFLALAKEYKNEN